MYLSTNASRDLLNINSLADVMRSRFFLNRSSRSTVSISIDKGELLPYFYQQSVLVFREDLSPSKCYSTDLGGRSQFLPDRR